MSDMSVVLQALEAVEHPTAEHVDLLLHSTLDLSEQVARGRALLRRWGRAAGPSASATPATRDPETAAREVIDSVLRGELHAAIELARALDWFQGCHEATEGLAFALYALALTDHFEQAETIIDEWKKRAAARAPDKVPIMLRTEAAIASQRYQFPRALALLREAFALCDAQRMAAAKAQTEAALAVAYARNNELEAAHAIIDRWPRAEAACNPVEGSRSIGRMEIALLEQRWPAAMRASKTALACCRAAPNAPLVSHVRFCRVLAAAAGQVPVELEAYRRQVHRSYLQHHVCQLAIVDRLQAMGHTTPRQVKLVARTPNGCESLPFVRLWTPRLDFANADIYWDRVHGVLHLGGDGPHALDGHPVLHRMLEVLAREPARAMPIPQLFEAVWGGSYDPLRNEGKVHVTVHRLRAWLKGAGRHSRRSLLEVRDGTVGLGRNVGIYLVELPGIGFGRPPHKERLLQCLAHGDTVSPRTLERRLEICRSTLTQMLRALLAEKRVERIGRGRATRYRAGGR